jgi:hypothetical protein
LVLLHHRRHRPHGRVNVVVAQHRLPLHRNTKHPLPAAALPAARGPKVELGEVQAHLIGTRAHRNGVAKRPQIYGGAMLGAVEHIVGSLQNIDNCRVAKRLAPASIGVGQKKPLIDGRGLVGATVNAYRIAGCQGRRPKPEYGTEIP